MLGLRENLAWIHWTPSHLLLESYNMKRTGFVLGAAKEDVIYSHPLCARYKPVPFITLATANRPPRMDSMSCSPCVFSPREE